MRSFNPSFVIESIPNLLAWLPITLLVLAATAVIGTVLGAILARSGLSRLSVLRRVRSDYWSSTLYTTDRDAFLNLLWSADHRQKHNWYGHQHLAQGIVRHRSLAILFSANMAEIMRAAYTSIDRGQREAAVSVGLSENQAFARIVLPQATAAALPNFTTALVNLAKDGSLAYTIGLVDMMGQGNLIIARNLGAYGLEIYTALAIIYWLFTIVLEKSPITLGEAPACR
jgi:L-cystine transport system permease protein